MVTSSTVQQARQEIAGRLREIRLDAGLTKRALAVEAGWHESKCSRIERALTPPSDADIRAWCGICGADDQAADLTPRRGRPIRRGLSGGGWNALACAGYRNL